MIEIHDRVVITGDEFFDGLTGTVVSEMKCCGKRVLCLETDDYVIVGRHNYRDGCFYEHNLELLVDDE